MKTALSLFVVALSVALAPAAHAATGAVPEVFSFQASLYDDGGNAVADGPVDLKLRITDAKGGVLYEELHTPDALGGEISVLLGGGLTDDGAPTGGIPASVFEPGEPRYVEAMVDGEPPTAPMEIASVPYALFANVAHSVTAGSVLFESLAGGVLEELAEALSGDGAGPNEVIVREDIPTMYAEPGAAATIGVTPAFNYSSSTDVQGVLADFDGAIRASDQARAQADQVLSASISAETVARQAADSALSQRIDSMDPSVNPPPVPQFHAGAWGHVSSCLILPATSSCANATATTLDASRCRVNFDTAMPGPEYAVVLSPVVSVISRDAGGFTVNCQGAAGCAFDFVVMAR